MWKIASDGQGEVTQITKQGIYESFAAPDGKTIFYTKDRETVGIWRVSTDSGEKRFDVMPVPELAEAGFRRSWTITGKGIHFLTRAAQTPYKIKFYDSAANQILEIISTD